MEKIIESVREVHNGGAPMTPRVARSVLDMFTRTARPHKDYGLPTREQKNPGADDPGPDQKRDRLEAGREEKSKRRFF